VGLALETERLAQGGLAALQHFKDRWSPASMDPDAGCVDRSTAANRCCHWPTRAGKGVCRLRR
jgi:hypothetical protein